MSGAPNTSTDIADLTYKAQNDLCLSFWAVAYDRWAIEFPPNATVLEIGCAEADWQTPMLALRPDLQITGIDWRRCDRPGTTVQGDVMALDTFERASFDCVVSISAIEHVGLGHYDQDPVFGPGDVVTMTNAHYWLKPGGWLYMDVPFAEDGFTVYKSYRRYDSNAIESRLLTPGFEIVQHARCETPHPDGPFMALLLRKV